MVRSLRLYSRLYLTKQKSEYVSLDKINNQADLKESSLVNYLRVKKRNPAQLRMCLKQKWLTTIPEAGV